MTNKFITIVGAAVIGALILPASAQSLTEQQGEYVANIGYQAHVLCQLKKRNIDKETAKNLIRSEMSEDVHKWQMRNEEELMPIIYELANYMYDHGGKNCVVTVNDLKESSVPLMLRLKSVSKQ